MLDYFFIYPRKFSLTSAPNLYVQREVLVLCYVKNFDNLPDRPLRLVSSVNITCR